MLRQDEHTEVIQRKELSESILGVRVRLSLCPTGVPPVLPESALPMDSLKKNLKGKPWLFHEVLDHCHNSYGQLEYSNELGPDL